MILANLFYHANMLQEISNYLHFINFCSIILQIAQKMGSPWVYIYYVYCVIEHFRKSHSLDIYYFYRHEIDHHKHWIPIYNSGNHHLAFCCIFQKYRSRWGCLIIKKLVVKLLIWNPNKAAAINYLKTTLYSAFSLLTSTSSLF